MQCNPSLSPKNEKELTANNTDEQQKQEYSQQQEGVNVRLNVKNETTEKSSAASFAFSRNVLGKSLEEEETEELEDLYEPPANFGAVSGGGGLELEEEEETDEEMELEEEEEENAKDEEEVDDDLYGDDDGEEDNEETLDEEERWAAAEGRSGGGSLGNEAELRELQDDAELSVEELRRKYYGGGGNSGPEEEQGEHQPLSTAVVGEKTAAAMGRPSPRRAAKRPAPGGGAGEAGLLTVMTTVSKDVEGSTASSQSPSPRSQHSVELGVSGGAVVSVAKRARRAAASANVGSQPPIALRVLSSALRSTLETHGEGGTSGTGRGGVPSIFISGSTTDYNTLFEEDEEEEEDVDYKPPDYWRKEPRIGPEYQADNLPEDKSQSLDSGGDSVEEKKKKEEEKGKITTSPSQTHPIDPMSTLSAPATDSLVGGGSIDDSEKDHDVLLWKPPSPGDDEEKTKQGEKEGEKLDHTLSEAELIEYLRDYDRICAERLQKQEEKAKEEEKGTKQKEDDAPNKNVSFGGAAAASGCHEFRNGGLRRKLSASRKLSISSQSHSQSFSNNDNKNNETNGDLSPPKTASGPTTMPVVPDNERALYILLREGHSVEGAKRRLEEENWEEEEGKRRMQFTDTTSEVEGRWSDSECTRFEQGLLEYGKHFHQIQQHKLPHHSVRALVAFYYAWKKTERHDRFIERLLEERQKQQQRDQAAAVEEEKSEGGLLQKVGEEATMTSSGTVSASRFQPGRARVAACTDFMGRLIEQHYRPGKPPQLLPAQQQPSDPTPPTMKMKVIGGREGKKDNEENAVKTLEESAEELEEEEIDEDDQDVEFSESELVQEGPVHGEQDEGDGGPSKVENENEKDEGVEGPPPDDPAPSVSSSSSAATAGFFVVVGDPSSHSSSTERRRVADGEGDMVNEKNVKK